MKIYVYDLPPKYNSEWLSNERCSTHLFASEVAIHRALLTSDVRTLDPREADFFFVPVYVSCNFSTTNGFPAIGHARSLLLSAVQLISSEHPFWNRSSGSDHVFVASHDYGACFHAMVNDPPKKKTKMIVLFLSTRTCPELLVINVRRSPRLTLKLVLEVGNFGLKFIFPQCFLKFHLRY